MPAEETEPLYFPPTTDVWETTDPASLNWNTDSLESMYTSLETNGTRAFIVLQDGKIVLEKYWGKTILGNADFDANKVWYWASAAKTLTAFTVGKAAEDGHINLANKTSEYLGVGWTSLTTEQENKITVLNQLTMTSGLDDGVANSDGRTPPDLVYKAEAGTRWAYHNAPYTLLENVVSHASNQSYSSYFNTVLQDKIGMTGNWQWSIDSSNHLYWSNARSAARFGLLMLNKGEWDSERLVNESFINNALNTSQDMNKSYGYLWWLNGKENIMLPESQIQLPGPLLSNAPSDVYSALGKNGQYISISPSKSLVIIRLGENPSDALVPLLYLNDIWGMMNDVMN